MIKFISVFYRNFLSTGNAGIKIDLTSSTVLVQGTSGSGKSTFIDAICFGLYGKPFRDINKPNLVNSINQKKCLVEVVFTTKGKTYKIRRGIKPNIFEIWCDETMINQNADSRDYQKILEQQILSMNMKTFTQITVLGSSAYVPFMQLKAADRRSVIEDILDISIFSVMNTLNKQYGQENKEKQQHIDSLYQTKKEKADGLKRIISMLSDKQTVEIERIKQKISNVIEETDILRDELNQLTAENKVLHDDIKKISELKEGRNRIIAKISAINTEKKQLNKRIEFFRQETLCPTCSTRLSDDYKEQMSSSILFDLTKTNEEQQKYNELQEKLNQKIDDLNQISNKIVKNNERILTIGTNLDLLERTHTELLNSLQDKISSSTDIEESRAELKTLAKEVIDLIYNKKELYKQKELQENAYMLLKDSGIKTAIIREYLPVINKLLNKYLSDMEMFVDFHLDENFNEVIKSRYRDMFTYGNFSAGEALRVDLAILFTWRHIAKLKNSANTNLLILDEILVGRLDATNTEIVIALLKQIAREGTNVFAIAHNELLQDKFNDLLTFEKQGDFTVMRQAV